MHIMIQEIWNKLACRCVQCTWVWFADNKERPKICPNRTCRSRKWNADLEQLEAMKPVDVRIIAAGPNREFKVAETRYRKCQHGDNEYTCERTACKIKTGR